MEKKTFEINGKIYPANLKDLKEDKDALSHYQIKPCYFLYLEHGLMGFFPAIVRESKDRVILTTNKVLLEKIWKILSPRRSKMYEMLCYVHENGLVAYEAQPNFRSDSDVQPNHLMTEEEFDLLTKENANPFQWAPGLIGNDMSHEEFLETIKAASEKI